MWTILLNVFGGFLARFGQPIVSFVSGFWMARQAAKNEQLREKVKTLETAKEVRDEVENRSDDAVQRDLSRWMRD